MFALIQKSDNTILRVSAIGAELSDQKPFYWAECPENCNLDWTFDGLMFTAPVPQEPEPYIPSSCSRRQGRLALLQAGYLESVEQLIANIEDPVQRKAAEIEYESDLWERNNAFLQSAWQALGGTQEDLDSLFSLAVTL